MRRGDGARCDVPTPGVPVIMMFGFVRGIARGVSSILVAAALDSRLIWFCFVLFEFILFGGGGVWIYSTSRAELSGFT